MTSKRNDSQANVTKQKQDGRLPPGVSKSDHWHRHQPTCIACGGPLPKPATYHKGRRRTTCTPACRQATYRRRQAGVPEDTPRIYHNEDVLDRPAYEARTRMI